MAIEDHLTSSLRRRSTPHRVIADRIILAHPDHGSAVALDPVSTTVWTALHIWRTVPELGDELAATYPAVDDDERRSVLNTIVDMLLTEGFIEQRP